jgi:hypothetical protein
MFRFTIRDMLWLTAVVALCAAWYVDHQRLESLARKFKTDAQLRRSFDSSTSIGDY